MLAEHQITWSALSLHFDCRQFVQTEFRRLHQELIKVDTVSAFVVTDPGENLRVQVLRRLQLLLIDRARALLARACYVDVLGRQIIEEVIIALRLVFSFFLVSFDKNVICHLSLLSKIFGLLILVVLTFTRIVMVSLGCISEGVQKHTCFGDLVIR